MSLPRWNSLPILDIARLDAGPSEKKAFLEELRETAHGIGFFYLTGHGIPEELIRQVLGVSRQFFELPEAEKLAIEMVNSPHFRGYTRVGWERTRGERDWREQIDIGDEEPAFPSDAGIPAWKRLQGPNQWPQSLPELRKIILSYQAAISDLTIRIIKAFSVSLGQPETVFDSIYTPNPLRLIKLIHYPGRESTGSDQGVGPHKDGGFVTVLLQDVQAGLQVEYEGKWIEAPPIPGTFVINIGEVLELASNGYLRATVHRVVTPPPDIDRLSVAAFLGPRVEATVPLLTLPENLATGVRGLTVDPLNPLFYEVGKNNLKGRLRSHPDVARRHYADLLDGDSIILP